MKPKYLKQSRISWKKKELFISITRHDNWQVSETRSLGGCILVTGFFYDMTYYCHDILERLHPPRSRVDWLTRYKINTDKVDNTFLLQHEIMCLIYFFMFVAYLAVMYTVNAVQICEGLEFENKKIVKWHLLYFILKEAFP